MSLFSDIGIGLRNYGKAIGFIFSNKLWWFFIFPILLNILLFFGGFAMVSMAIDTCFEWTMALISFDDPESALAVYIGGFLKALLWVLFKALFILVFAFAGGYIVLMLLSPVFAYLSERTEKILTGNEYPFNIDQTARDVARGILIAFRNLFIELMYMIGAFIVSFIPVVGWLSPFALFFVSAYFYGFSFLDYSNERRRMSVGESIRFIRSRKGIAIGNGSVFALLLLIPFCGVTLAGFAAIIAVVAATLSMHEIVDFNLKSSEPGSLPGEETKQLDDGA